IDQYRIHSSASITNQFSNDLSGTLSGFGWTGTNAGGTRFFRVQGTPMSSNRLLSAHCLNRLAYGPTPDDLERLALIGPQQYISEQLDMGSIVENGDASTVSLATNGVNPPTTPHWVYVEVTGRATTGSSKSNLYVYLTAPGTAYIDDLQIVAPTNNLTIGNLVN